MQKIFNYFFAHQPTYSSEQTNGPCTFRQGTLSCTTISIEKGAIKVMKDNNYYEELKSLLETKIGPTNPDTYKNKTMEKFADYFTQTLLLSAFNCPQKDFKSSEFLVASCFYGGIVTNLVYQNIDRSDIEYIGTLQSVLELNLFHTEELLRTSIGVLGKVGWLETVDKKKQILFSQSLTHQINVNETGLLPMLTMMFAIFMVSSAIKLQ